MKSKTILYSFRRCPFAIRARWALLKNDIKVIIREIDLKDKPTELLKLSHKATVPVLYTSNGYVLDESMDIIHWALKNSIVKNPPKDYLKISSKEIYYLIKLNDNKFKYHLDRFKYASRYKADNKIFHQSQALKILKYLNKKLSKSKEKGFQGWLVEDSESIADWSIWPFVRQYLIADPNLFKREKELFHLENWLNHYTSQEAFKIVMKKMKKWDKNDSPIYFGV
tara:strand:- start:557 stop:1231 length:675 start_codon:yes stop_codon:yes gene_type:complete